MPWSRAAGISGTELGCYSHFTTEVDDGMRKGNENKISLSGSGMCAKDAKQKDCSTSTVLVV